MTGPLAGRRVVVTRTAEQAGRLREVLARAGAEVLEVPVIEVVDPVDGGAALRAAADRLVDGRYAWVVITSANGAARLAAALGSRRVPDGTAVAAVGPATADALAAHGFEVALVPERYVGEALVEAFPPPPAGEERPVLVAQAEGARPVVAEGLRAAGWTVDAVVAYRTVAAVVPPALAAEARRADAITFTSGSTVRNALAALGPDGLPPVVACIGPVTAAEAEALGVTVTVVSAESTLASLVDALASVWRPRA